MQSLNPAFYRERTQVWSAELINGRVRFSNSQACKLFTVPHSYCLVSSPQYEHKSIDLKHEVFLPPFPMSPKCVHYGLVDNVYHFQWLLCKVIHDLVEMQIWDQENFNPWSLSNKIKFLDCLHSHLTRCQAILESWKGNPGGMCMPRDSGKCL